MNLPCVSRAQAAFGTLLLACSTATAADELPLWEAGFGIAPISFPEYRGAGTQRQFVLPLPYLVYRGEYLQVDRGGLRGLLLDTQRFDVDLSLDGAVPVTSSDDSPRSGMPDLDPVLEGGLSISFLLAEGNRGRLRLRLPLRAATAVDLGSIHHVGWKANPQLHAETQEEPGRWSLSVATGPLFADRRYHSYYYGVAGKFATLDRPAYQASGGYSGWGVVAAASRRFERTWVGVFLRYDNLAGARFLDSPLVETRHAVMAGFGVARVFRQSRLRVPPQWSAFSTGGDSFPRLAAH